MTDEWAELFNERAAILEYDGGMSRREAEEKAAQDVEIARHRAEVRSCIKISLRLGKYALRAYFEDVEKQRGPGLLSKLKRDVLEQYQKGNRGEPGRWVE